MNLQAHRYAMETAELADDAQALLDKLHEMGWNGIDLRTADGTKVPVELGLALLVDTLRQYSADYRQDTVR